MKLGRFALGSLNNGLSRRFHQPCMRTIFTNATSGGGVNDNRNTNSFESPDDFERRIFGETSGDYSKPDSFYEKLDRLGKTRDGHSSNLAGGFGIGNGSHALDGLDESFTTLSDGMDEKLEEAATYFEMDDEEIEKEDYTFRPDVNFEEGMTYDIKDLDLTKRGVWREGPPKYEEFEVTTKEVLKKADFRNVRFLAKFITEAGILHKRSKFGISAKAQRKVAREIKTARAFGLMPFTTMGTKSFVFGRTMESLDQDYEYESYDNPTDDPYGKDPLET